MLHVSFLHNIFRLYSISRQKQRIPIQTHRPTIEADFLANGDNGLHTMYSPRAYASVGFAIVGDIINAIPLVFIKY